MIVDHMLGLKFSSVVKSTSLGQITTLTALLRGLSAGVSHFPAIVKLR